MDSKKKYVSFIVISIFLIIGIVYVLHDMSIVSETVVQNDSVEDIVEEPLEKVVQSIEEEKYLPDVPLDQYEERMTKKPFGIFITPENSPVSPERFYGYHTGVDFEIMEDEVVTEIAVRAICDGTIKEKKYISGYGGVVVQGCVIDDETVSIIYGHLRLSDARGGGDVRYGDEIGFLGKAYSTQTSNERKHLHLGIYRGSGIDVRGYVQDEDELSQWMDPCSVIDCVF